jgi:hypothetical protein
MDFQPPTRSRSLVAGDEGSVDKVQKTRRPRSEAVIMPCVGSRNVVILGRFDWVAPQ